jgi:hypothetical protein
MSNVIPAAPRRGADRAIYNWVALAAVIIVFTGFARTYYLKDLFGAPALSSLVHLHGLVMTAWFLLFVVQVRLVAGQRVGLHRKLGWLGAVLAVLVLGVGTVTAITAARLGHSPGPPPLMFLSIPLGDMVVFAGLTGLGLAYRQQPAVHKRLILLGSVGILTAAIARIPVDFILHGGPPVFFGLTDLCVLACVAGDTWKNRRLHPAMGWGMGFIVASQVFRLWLAGTPQWLQFATWLTS